MRRTGQMRVPVIADAQEAIVGFDMARLRAHGGTPSSWSRSRSARQRMGPAPPVPMWAPSALGRRLSRPESSQTTPRTKCPAYQFGKRLTWSMWLDNADPASRRASSSSELASGGL
jgi:hypothetical protein